MKGDDIHRGDTAVGHWFWKMTLMGHPRQRKIWLWNFSEIWLEKNIWKLCVGGGGKELWEWMRLPQEWIWERDGGAERPHTVGAAI